MVEDKRRPAAFLPEVMAKKRHPLSANEKKVMKECERVRKILSSSINFHYPLNLSIMQ